MSLISVLSLVAGLNAATAAPAPSDKQRLARASAAVSRECPGLPRQIFKSFGIAAEAAGVGVLALFETPIALMDYLISDANNTPESRHNYYPRTDALAEDVVQRYHALLEGVDSPACLRAICDVERLKSADRRPVSPACSAEVD